MKPIAAALLGLVLCSYFTTASAQNPLSQLTAAERKARRETPEVLVVRQATASVVYIQTNKEQLVQDRFGWVRRQNNRSSGSGVVLTPDGYVITNYHVVKDATELRISFEKSIDEAVYDADIVSFVAEEDLALLKIQNPGGREFRTLPIGSSSDLMIGEPVLAIGNPYGHTHTVSSGIISGLHRGVPIRDSNSNLSFNFDDLIQTDASINPGNSGGPLLNINGELIGINNAVNANAENIGFAIPIDRVQDVLEQQLISPDRFNAWLGFDIADDDSLTVSGVFEGSPAALAGLKIGDRILGFDKGALENRQEYQLTRLALRPGWVELHVARGEKTLRIPVQGWNKPDGIIFERLGVRAELDTYGRDKNLTLRQVQPGGAAGRIGLAVGDQLMAVRPTQVGARGLMQNYRVTNVLALAAFLENFPAGSELGVEIRRGDSRYQGTVVLE